MGTLKVVVGGQYGSEAKGAVAGWLCATDTSPKLACMRVAGPNAGHTVHDEAEQEWKLRSVPVAGPIRHDAELLIAPGSEVEWAVLNKERDELDRAGHGVTHRLWIDHRATVLTDEHKAREGVLVGDIGSTGKGIGAARADRVMRCAELVGGDIDATEIARAILSRGGTLVVEGTQGYGLGLHTDNYPFCTSSDCRAIDFLAMAGINPWDPVVDNLEIWVVFRTYPIRVAGNSGPMYDETSWDQLGQATDGYIQPERTTVTNKVRRVGAWDDKLAHAALRANGASQAPWNPVRVALMHLDYLIPEVAGVTGRELRTNPVVAAAVGEFEESLDFPVHAVSTGPGKITTWRL